MAAVAVAGTIECSTFFAAFFAFHLTRHRLIYTKTKYGMFVVRIVVHKYVRTRIFVFLQPEVGCLWQWSRDARDTLRLAFVRLVRLVHNNFNFTKKKKMFLFFVDAISELCCSFGVDGAAS